MWRCRTLSRNKLLPEPREDIGIDIFHLLCSTLTLKTVLMSSITQGMAWKVTLLDLTEVHEAAVFSSYLNIRLALSLNSRANSSFRSPKFFTELLRLNTDQTKHSYLPFFPLEISLPGTILLAIRPIFYD